MIHTLIKLLSTNNKDQVLKQPKTNKQTKTAHDVRFMATKIIKTPYFSIESYKTIGCDI